MSARPANSLDQGRGRSKCVLVVDLLPGESHRRACCEKLREQESLLGETVTLEGQVREYPESASREHSSQRVWQNRVFVDWTREAAPVEPQKEEMTEGSRAGFDDVEDLYATALAAQCDCADLQEGLPQQFEELLISCRKIGRQAACRAPDACEQLGGDGLSSVPAELVDEQSAEPLEVFL